MSLDQDLKKALNEFKKQNVLVFPATVTSVDEAAKTISCKDTDDFEYNDVRLAAAEDNKKSVLLIPKINSTVLIGLIGDQLNALFVVKINEAEKVIGTIETTNFKIDASGYQVKRGDESLKTVLNNLIDEINKIKVIYGNTINVIAVNEIKERLNNILIE